MISESLKTNTTLTTLWLSCDEKIMLNEIKIGRKRAYESDNEQITVLEQKEPG